MRWQFASVIRLLFLYIHVPQAISSIDMCSSITYSFSSDNDAVSLLVKDINIMPRNCTCEITTNRAIAVCLSYACSQCRSDNDCPSDLPVCFCSDVDLTTTPTCMPLPTFGNRICQGVSYKEYSCDRSTTFTLNLSTKPLTSCGIGENIKNLDLIIELQVPGHDFDNPDPVFKEVRCNVRSVKPTVKPTVTPAAESDSKPDDGIDKPMIIGIVVGVGGAILLTTAIVIVIVVCRRRRSESNKPHANDASRVTPAAAAATGEAAAYESYPISVLPTMTANDNATIGATSSYQTLAYDNERVGEAINPYAELKVPEERGDDNGYDNSRLGGNDVRSMYKEAGKDYDNFSENSSTNVENETTVIDNEFYG